MNKKYKTGRRREWEARNLLRIRGWTVLRSAGSKSVFDIIALNEELVRFIQIKSSKKKVIKYSEYEKDIQQIEAVKVPKGCVKELWIKPCRGDWDTLIIK